MKKYMVLVQGDNIAHLFDKYEDANNYYFTAASQNDDPIMFVWVPEHDAYEWLYC